VLTTAPRARSNSNPCGEYVFITYAVIARDFSTRSFWFGTIDPATDAFTIPYDLRRAVSNVLFFFPDSRSGRSSPFRLIGRRVEIKFNGQRAF